jgi:hypothetical protein
MEHILCMVFLTSLTRFAQLVGAKVNGKWWAHICEILANGFLKVPIG